MAAGEFLHLSYWWGGIKIGSTFTSCIFDLLSFSSPILVCIDVVIAALPGLRNHSWERISKWDNLSRNLWQDSILCQNECERRECQVFPSATIWSQLNSVRRSFWMFCCIGGLKWFKRGWKHRRLFPYPVPRRDIHTCPTQTAASPAVWYLTVTGVEVAELPTFKNRIKWHWSCRRNLSCTDACKLLGFHDFLMELWPALSALAEARSHKDMYIVAADLRPAGVTYQCCIPAESCRPLTSHLLDVSLPQVRQCFPHRLLTSVTNVQSI